MECPGRHVHAVDSSEASGEVLPAAQWAQSDEPVAVLYFPAAHCVHSAPPAPVYPSLHLHVEMDAPTPSLLPPVLPEKCGHAVQVSMSLSTLLYVSSGHHLHSPVKP